MLAIEVKDVVKYYRLKKGKIIKALDGVSLKVKKGELFGLLGPNGAGKTTLTKILATLILPDEGEAYIAGHNVLKEPMEIRRKIGWMQGETGGRALYWRLSARDNLKYFAVLQGVKPEIADKRINALLDFFDLGRDADRLIREFSSGMKIKVLLIRALLHNPEILLLDEPTSGLDVTSATKVRHFIKRLSRELDKTILITSHNMYEIEQLCDRIAMINKGKIIYEGTPQKIKELLQTTNVIEIRLRDSVPINDIEAKLLSSYNAKRMLKTDRQGELLIFRVEVEDPYDAVIEFVEKLKGHKVESIGRVLPTLEETFLKVIGEATWESN